MTLPHRQADRPINKALWLVGKDNGSTGYDVLLEWSDGSFHALFRIEPGADAMAVGMIIGAYPLPSRLTATDPRADGNAPEQDR